MAGTRSLVRMLALVALAVLAACGSKGAERPVLRIATWTNYMNPDVLKEFGDANGCTVDASTTAYEDNDGLLALLRKGVSGLDIAIPSDSYVPALAAEGTIEPIDRASLGNLGHSDPAFSTRTGDAEGKWSVPYTWGTIGIAWRTDKVKTPPDSWGVFADASIAADNRFLLSEARDVVSCALLFRGHDVNATDAASLADAKETLLAWKKTVKDFTGETKDHLLTGDAWLIQAYNGDVAQAMSEPAQKGKLAFAVPKEGGILWIDDFVIPKGAPHKALAHKFIDYVLDPKVAARISAYIHYALVNKDVGPLLDPAIRNDPVIYAPDDVRKRLHQYKDVGADLPKLTNVYTEVRGG
jgi:spermidine/putrescine-binding protein